MKIHNSFLYLTKGMGLVLVLIVHKMLWWWEVFPEMKYIDGWQIHCLLGHDGPDAEVWASTERMSVDAPSLSSQYQPQSPTGHYPHPVRPFLSCQCCSALVTHKQQYVNTGFRLSLDRLAFAFYAFLSLLFSSLLREEPKQFPTPIQAELDSRQLWFKNQFLPLLPKKKHHLSQHY